MRKHSSLAALLAAVLATAAFGQTATPTREPPAIARPHPPVQGGRYTNSAGARVRRPVQVDSGGSAPAGATAQCRDGSYSFSMHHRGTCSHHGGVARWL